MGRLQSIWKYTVEAAAIIGCLGTIFFGWLTIRVTHDMAEQSRSFDKPELRLLLGRFELEPGVENRLFLGAPLSEGKAVNYASIPYVIRNTGQKSAKNIDVTDRFPKLARTQLQDITTFEIEGVGPRQSQFTQEMKEIGQASYIHYMAEAIDPGITIGLNEPFILDKTEFESDVKLEHMTARIKVKYALQQLLTVGAEDQLRRDYPVNIVVTDVRNESELIGRVEEALKERLASRRSQLPYLTALRRTLREDAYFAFVEPKLTAEHDGVRLYETLYPVESVKSITVTQEPQLLLMIIYLVDALMILITAIAIIGRWRRRRELAGEWGR
jgi:hypothetical protein